MEGGINRSGRGTLSALLVLLALLAGGVLGCEDDDSAMEPITIIGRLGGAPDPARVAELQAELGVEREGLGGTKRDAVTSVDGVEVVLYLANCEREDINVVGRAFANRDGYFVFDDIRLTPEQVSCEDAEDADDVIAFHLRIEQDEFDQVAYAAASSPICFDRDGYRTAVVAGADIVANITVDELDSGDHWAERYSRSFCTNQILESDAMEGISLPIVSRFLLPAYPRTTTGSPIAIAPSSDAGEPGRVVMAIDQGVMIIDVADPNLAQLLYRSDGFGSEQGPRLVHVVNDEVVIMTPDKIWFIDLAIFDGAPRTTINLDDPAVIAAHSDQIVTIDVPQPGAFIETARRSEEFDPDEFRFWSDERRLFVATREEAAIIDYIEHEIIWVFHDTGRLVDVDEQMYFVDGLTLRVVDPDALETDPVHFMSGEHDFSLYDAHEILGVERESETGSRCVSFTKLNTQNREIPFLACGVAFDDIYDLRDFENFSMDEALNPSGFMLEPEPLLRNESGDSTFMALIGDTTISGLGERIERLGAVRLSLLDALGVRTNQHRRYLLHGPVPYILTYFGEEDAGLGFYGLGYHNLDVAVRPITGRVPVVIVDEEAGIAYVAGDEGLAVVYYNYEHAAETEATEDLRDLAEGLIGMAAGDPCNSTEPCPEGGICAPLDEFNTDSGTCTPQIRDPWRRYCGGLTGVECDFGFECLPEVLGNDDAAGVCRRLECDEERPCPDPLRCHSFCDPLDLECDEPSVCVCDDMTRCGPACDADADCPDGYLCSGDGHCGLDRCLDDSGCPEGMVCGVTESGRACVEPGGAAIGEPCAASAECASAYCRAGVCELSCTSTGECPAGQECLADARAGYCADPECGGCAADEICRDGICDAAESCVEDADCGAVGVCVDGDCWRSCAVTADCDPDQTCVQGPPHIESLYCLDNGSGLVPCASPEGEGCADGAWCSEWGSCQTGTPCRDYDASACEPDQLCVQNACVTPCAASSECEAGEECVGGYLGMAPTEEGEALVMSCEPAVCNCPNADDVCITWTAGVQGECWSWEDCGATGTCDEGYGCDPAADGSPRCRCQDLEACGPRCVDDDSCPENHVCDGATGRCVWDGCDDDGDCEAGEVCGLPDGSMQRACMEPGTRAPGAPCDRSSQCTTGVCFEGDCITVCSVTGDCEEGESCGTGDLPPHIAEYGLRACGSGGVPCTDDEWQLVDFGWCTDGRECSPSEPCPWPLECAPDAYAGVEYCICTADVCTTTCAAAEECGDARLDCVDGLCRPLSLCSSSADCAADRVCGLLEGSETAGRRCITAGTAIAGEDCATHAECASGICADGLCTTSCEATSDCEAGDECASVFGGAVAVCGSASCGCASDEVCTTTGECGAGPICLDDGACVGDDICVDELCRQTCDVTGDCLPSEDCVALAADTPSVCAEAGCGCAADEVCEGGVCFVSTPCVTHSDCATGRCYRGQCREACNSTAVCPVGLECVAVNVDEHTFEMERLCVTPTCDCPDADSWCHPGGFCYRGDDCSSCSEGGDWICTDPPMELWSEFAGERICECTNLEVCGPSCDGPDDCPDDRVCTAEGRCVVQSCADDSECPTGTICGTSSTWGWDMLCRRPGLQANGEACTSPSECASGACVGNLCGDLCRSTAECPAGQECIFGRFESHELDNVQAACREPECDCRVDTDVCNSNARDGGTARECVRLEGTPCNFMSPCDSGYFCDEFAGDVCRCSDLGTCGPVCTSHDDCGVTQVCDETTSACEMRHCLDNSVCPAGYGCIVSSRSRFCAVISGAGVVGDSCDSWSDCVSGMCVESVCVEPCTQNADCSGTQTCQTPTFVMWHEAYPFCFDWTPPCADCDGADQFCDYYGSCQTGPVCTSEEDCTSGSCDGDRLVCTL